MSDFVIPLGTADAVPTALGGRGDRLNRLALDRLPVEPGLVLTSAAYSAFVRFNNLESELAAMEELDPADPAALVSAAVRIRRRFLEATLPPTLAERLDVLWANLAGRTLQVQASWHPETPTPSASAGTRLRYAPVDNRAALLSAVRACWASVWTAPLLNRQAAEPVAVAVIVQETMQPSASGTLSTGVREAGRTEELIITASAGDASLRGRMAAQERYVIDKGRGDVKHVQLGAEPLLNPDLLTELALAGLAAEQTMAQPLTITWALVRGRFIIVQADPLLAHEDAATSADWSRAVVGAHWPEPLTPLTWSLWAPLLTRAGRDVAARWRLFPRGEAPDPWLSRINGHLVWQQKRLVEAFSAAYGLPAGLTTSTDGPEKGSRWRYRSLLRRLPRLVRLWRRPAASAAGAGSDGRESAATEQQAGDALWLGGEPSRLAGLQAHLTRYTGLAAGVAVLDRFLSALGDGEGPQATRAPQDRWNPAGVAPLAALPAALHRLAQTLQDPALASIQRQSDSAAALEQLRRHPAAEPFRQQLARFLSRYGYLSLNAAELRHPRWIEHPDQLLALLSGADLNSEGPSPSSRQVGLDPASPRPNGGALARPRRALSAWLRRRQSRWLVQQAESYTAMLGQLLPLRQRAMLLADRWVQQGWLDRADDLFFLSLTEIECVLQMGSPDAAGFSSTDLATHRRASHRRWRRRETTGVARRAEQLHGAPLSPGRVRGRARVVSDPSGAAAVRSGEILVTLAAEAGWTALFSRIGGLVIEMGHRHGPASTVARAIGLPAVANVSDATRRVVTGQWVVVDGHSGHIVLED